jgi:NAD-dependent SIR2 family protein deacetylase
MRVHYRRCTLTQTERRSESTKRDAGIICLNEETTEASDAQRDAQCERLARFIRLHPRLMVLTGAGCSTASGIPEYRDDEGNWKHTQPMQFADFVAHAAKRRRSWAQSYAGWERISTAKPKAAHRAIADLERSGNVRSVITQNVDNLHRVAGSQNVIDLHGVLHRIRCLECNRTASRQTFQETLRQHNPDWRVAIATIAPDGDASLQSADFEHFKVPDCSQCGGIIKPHVVFFGEAIPTDRVAKARAHLDASDALLVVGSSLMVYSGFRFARIASETGKPIVIVNRGVTRADHLATEKLTHNCTDLLAESVAQLAA